MTYVVSKMRLIDLYMSRITFAYSLCEVRKLYDEHHLKRVILRKTISTIKREIYDTHVCVKCTSILCQSFKFTQINHCFFVFYVE